MDLILWAAQILLGLAFVGAGFTHMTRRAQATGGMAWMQAVPQPALTTIGALEILGGIGLIVPAATGILPWLTPLAAALLALLMAFAIAFHVARKEVPNIVFNAILGLVAAFIAYGRSFVEPL